MCRNWFCKEMPKPAIPTVVSNKERLVRFILSPFHFTKDGKQLRTSAFNPSIGTEEVSVTRLDYSSIKRCKELAHKLFSGGKAQYCGFGLLNKAIAIDCGAKDVVSSPVEDNPAHANILLGIVRPNDAIPSEILYILDNLLDKVVFLRDPNPDSPDWDGDSLML